MLAYTEKLSSFFWILEYENSHNNIIYVYIYFWGPLEKNRGPFEVLLNLHTAVAHSRLFLKNVREESDM